MTRTSSSKKNTYKDESIQILEGLEAVRKRPGMYIGSTDSRGLHHLVYEIVDNAVDEALNGWGSEITITLKKDGSIEVIDHGRGVPCGKHPSGKNTLEVVYGVLHAGGKFTEDGGYSVAGGLHGVGGSVVNALSEWMVITSKRDGISMQIKFKDGGSQVEYIKELGKTQKTGTTVCFKPDSKIFSDVNFKFNTIAERMRERSFLIDGLRFIIKDERNNKEADFCYKNGLSSFLDYLGDNTVERNIIMESKSEAGIQVKVGLAFSKQYNEEIYSFANLVRTIDGGTHEVGLKNALTRAINEYGKKSGLIKNKLEGADIREGLIAVVNVNIPENLLQFEGQTKSKLGTPEAKTAVEGVVYDYLKHYLQENSIFAKKIIDKMVKAASVREAAKKARDEARSGKNKAKVEKLLSGKLAPARSKDSKKNELFLVEGDSAGGSAKQGRDSSFQAILPLRGKVLNVERSDLSDVLQNEELNTIIHCLGAGYGNEIKTKNLKYDKVIIMTDADTDGAHIQCLLLTFFYRYMKPLIEEGHVFLAVPPLYKATKGSTSAYAYDEKELTKVKKNMGKCTIQRFKGLGEMNASQLWDTTMDPEKRRILRVTIEDAIEAEKNIKTLMGNKSDIRKEWINNNVDFRQRDEYKIQEV